MPLSLLMSPRRVTTVDDILSELKVLYAHERTTDLGQPGLPPRITASDVDRWSEEVSLDCQSLFDAIGVALATGFYFRALNFAFCDAVVNDLRDTQDPMTFWYSGLFWDVYLCFDDGEYHRLADKSDDPVEDFTRPGIRRLLAGL